MTPNKHPHVAYRPEIDGLRAIAIVPVVFFHAGFSAFRGGFIGVDVFFVISGYLITSIILSDLQRTGFSYSSFYERRARRLLPALIAVLSLSLPLAFLLLPPEDLTYFFKSLLATLFFSSNILFWRRSGYFDLDAGLKPLFHTWSLAVEEQFYLVFPVLILVTWRYWRHRMGAAIVAAAAVSFAIAQYCSSHFPVTGFYWLFPRMWELLAGAYVAYRENLKPISLPPLLASLLADSGFLATVVSIALFTPQTQHPALPTLFPVIGTALVIAFGRARSLSNWLLKRHLLVQTGLISYSLYLWHQPVFAFFRYYTFGQTGTVQLLALSLASVLLAYLTWRFIERPFRDKKRITIRSAATAFSAFALLLTSVAACGLITKGFPSRVRIPDGLQETFARLPEMPCFDTPLLHEHPERFCTFGPGDKPVSIFVFGDSHAYAMLPAFLDLSRALNMRMAFASYSSCLPFLGLTRFDPREPTFSCSLLNQQVRKYVHEKGIKKLVLIGYWATHTEANDKHSQFNLEIHEGDKLTLSQSRAAFAYGLSRTIASYSADNVSLYVLSDIPEQLFVPEAIYREAYMRNPDAPQEAYSALKAYSVSFQDHLALTKFNRELFLKNRDRISYVNLDPLYCTSSICPIGTPTASYYFDYNHLSMTGARVAEPELRGIFLRGVARQQEATIP